MPHQQDADGAMGLKVLSASLVEKDLKSVFTWFP